MPPPSAATAPPPLKTRSRRVPAVPEAPQTAPLEPLPQPIRQRLHSLDVFRGLTIAAMILVNNPGSWGAVYGPLDHAEWNGWTPTDLIFPFFLFIVGVATPLSLAGRRAKAEASGEGTGPLLRGILRRGLTIIALGLLLTAIPYNDHTGLLAPEKYRFFGVLQRIGLCYLIAGPIILYTNWRRQVWIIATLLLVYTGIMLLIPAPGYPPGDLSIEGNLAGYIDNSLLPGHLWLPKFDPEGLLSTLPAIATTLFGALAGAWLRTTRTSIEKAAGLMTAGTLGLIAGYVMDGLVMPVNKNLWTSSYSVFMAGMAALGLGVCYYIVDVHGRDRWAKPFTVFGLNAIAAFMFSGVLGRLMLISWIPQANGSTLGLKSWIFNTIYKPHFALVNASLLFAITYVLFWLGVMWILYRKRIFIKV